MGRFHTSLAVHIAAEGSDPSSLSGSSSPSKRRNSVRSGDRDLDSSSGSDGGRSNGSRSSKESDGSKGRLLMTPEERAVRDEARKNAKRSGQVSGDASSGEEGGGWSSPSGPGGRKARNGLKWDGDIAVDRLDMMTEEERFVQILDHLEKHDEFESTSDSEASELGEDDDLHSDSDEEDDDISRWEERAYTLADWELDAAWHALGQRHMPSVDVCTRIVRGVIRIHAACKCVCHVPKPEQGSQVIVVGDLHGHFADFMHIMNEYGDPQLGPGGVRYVFNGDFVDRGAWGPEVLMALYTLKLKCPNGIFMNRGNHEDQQQNLKPDNGFVHSHCTRAWGLDAQSMYKLVRRSFKELPLVHVIGREVCVLHGGLPLDPFITLHDIDAIDRRRGVPVFHCSLLGYPRFQRVKAKRDLRTDDGEQVLAGSMGKLIDRVGKSHKAFVRFSSAHGNDEVEVVIWGSPELEEDVEIYYETDEERKRHRSNRLFVSLLWSDPIHSKKDLGPSKRGAGCCFDERITNEFLKTNKLTMLLRSHEKRDSGYSEEHRSKDGKALSAATIFSASNYPSGAGEPKGNKGAVILLKASNDGTPLSQNFSFSKSWRKCYDDQSFNTIHLSNELREKFLRAEEQNKRSVSARARALAKLRELTYCARPKLLAYWQKADKDGTGVIEMKHWSSGLRACVIPDDDFPWEWLCSYMLKTYSENATDYNYASYLAQYENSLSRKLADRWHGGAVLQICQGVLTTKDAEKAWARIDKNGDGRLSYQELKPLLKSRLSSDVQSDEDRVYSVMSKMDKNRSGYVDRHEFIEAVSRCLGGRSILEEANDGQLSARGKRSLLLQQELDQWGEQEVSQCWAAAQGAIRALSATTGCASSVFEVLDEDDDGVIDRSEFQQGLHQLLRGSPLLKCIDKWEPLLWKLVDEDGSGYVSPEELNLAFSVREVLSI